MSFITRAAAIAAVSLLQVGCNPADQPTAPSSPGSEVSASRLAGGATISMVDQCEPTSFNVVLGPGTCVGGGTVTFDDFIAELTRSKHVNAWQFVPPTANMLVGGTLAAVNLGGETHTFTEVEEFGGGIVSTLNNLMGLTTIAPECLTLQQEDFIPPGGSDSEVEDEEGTDLYQCCIHPWMRAKVHIHK